MAEASPPAQVNGDYGISSLSRVEGRSSESCRRRAVQGNYEAQIDDRPPQPEALTETDTGVERTEAHRAASNRQCHFTVPASPTGMYITSKYRSRFARVEETRAYTHATSGRGGGLSPKELTSRRLSAPDSPPATPPTTVHKSSVLT